MQNLTQLSQTSAGNITAGKNFTVAGNLTVTGTTTQVNTVSTQGNMTFTAGDNLILSSGYIKAHYHSIVAGSDYANEFKGEFLNTTGFGDGLAIDYHQAASGTAIMRAIRGVAYLDSGISMTGTDYSSQSWLAGGLFQATSAGTLNGAGVCVMGLYGGIGTCAGSTLTAAKYLTSIWADSQRNVTLSSGQSSLLLMTNSNTSSIDYGIRMECNSTGAINCAIDLNGIVVGTNAGGDQASLIRCGTAGAKKLFATDYQQGQLYHLKTTGGRFTGFEMNVYTEYEGDNPQTDHGLRGVEVIARSLVNDGGGAPDMYAICGSVQILASRDMPIAGSKMAAGYFSYSLSATATYKAGSAYVLYLETGSGAQATQGDFMIKMISNNAAATPLTAFITSAGGASYFMEFDNTMTPANGMAWSYKGAVSGTQAGWFKVRSWNGSSWTDGYVPFYPSGATS